jgi:hypothetical protein
VGAKTWLGEESIQHKLHNSVHSKSIKLVNNRKENITLHTAAFLLIRHASHHTNLSPSIMQNTSSVFELYNGFGLCKRARDIILLYHVVGRG